jgi:hypothetical protein
MSFFYFYFFTLSHHHGHLVAQASFWSAQKNILKVSTAFSTRGVYIFAMHSRTLIGNRNMTLSTRFRETSSRRTFFATTNTENGVRPVALNLNGSPVVRVPSTQGWISSNFVSDSSRLQNLLPVPSRKDCLSVRGGQCLRVNHRPPQNHSHGFVPLFQRNRNVKFVFASLFLISPAVPFRVYLASELILNAMTQTAFLNFVTRLQSPSNFNLKRSSEIL